MRTSTLIIPILLALSACASQPAAEPSAPATLCNADAAQPLLGQPASATNVEAARKASGAASVRSLTPNQPMTLDYRGDRLNVVQDADGNIVKITCG